MWVSRLLQQQLSIKVVSVRVLFCLLIGLGLVHSQAICASSVIAAPEMTVRSFPFYSQKLMSSWWQPLREHIYVKTGILVRISAAHSYASLLDESAQQSYDIYFAPDHFVSLMVSEHGANPLVIMDFQTHPLLIYRNNLALEYPANLQGSCVAMVHEFALSAMLAKQWFANQNLTAERDYRPIYLTSYDEVALKVLRGECETGVVTSGIFSKLPAPISEELIKIKIPIGGGNLGGLSLLANSNSDNKKIDALRRAMLSFGTDERTAGHLSSPLYSVPSVYNRATLEALERRYGAVKPLLLRYLSAEK